MPTYQYRCQACGGTFDVKRGIKDQVAKVACPACGNEDCRQVYSVWSLFKGGCAPQSDGPVRFG